MSRPKGHRSRLRTPHRLGLVRRILLAVMLAMAVPIATGRTDSDETPPPSPTTARVPDNEFLPTPLGPPAILLSLMSFEDGEGVVASTQATDKHGLTTTEDAVRMGARAGVALLEATDGQYRGRLGYRAEWQSEYHAAMDIDYWYGASYYLPADWDQGKNDNFFNDRIIFQFHEGTGASPAFSLHIRPDPLEFFVRRREDEGFDYLWEGELEEERWYDFAFHVRWTDEDDGLFEVYLDGEQVVSYTGPTLVDGKSVYTKWGIYGQPTKLLVDEVGIAIGMAQGLNVVSPQRPTP